MPTLPVFQIKICGVTRELDALAAANAGADAVGLNFYSGSRRFVSDDAARAIVAALPATVQKVGVFVNASAEEISARLERTGFTAIQLHGDEPPELLRDLPAVPTLRAFRLRDSDLRPVLDYLARCQQLGVRLDGLLIDAFAAGSYGGTGHTADWGLAARLREELGELPLVLAGGLKPENVAAAIAAVRPAAVDTASGVETSPGVKDAALIKAFVVAAKSAFERVKNP